MKISILLPDLRGGGAERVMIDLSYEFNRLGHSVEFALMKAVGEFLPTAQREFKIFDLRAPRTRKVPIALSKYIRERKPDAIIANMWPLTSAAVIGRSLSQHPCCLLLMEHNALAQQYSSWGKLHGGLLTSSIAATYRFADVVGGVSKGVAESTARLAKLPSDRVKVLHNPIPKPQALSSEAIEYAEQVWNCPAGQRILTVGSFKDQKNHLLLLQAFANIRDPEARLMLLGQGAKEAALREMSVKLEIQNQVIFAGFQSNPTPFYQTANLFALSSNHEGLPTVLIEALACGIPVVSTDCPSGPAEILENGKYGRLVPVRDSQALANAIQESLTKPHDPAFLKQRASEFSPEIAAKRYLDLLCP